jgi:hypothetical protein
VEKSVESYLAKYLSKCVSKEQEATINTPSRWWSISSTLRKKMLGERRSESFGMETFEDALDQAESVAALAVRDGLEVKPIVNKYNGMPLGFVVFCSQDLKGWHFEWFKELVRNRVKMAFGALFPSYELKRTVGYG